MWPTPGVHFNVKLCAPRDVNIISDFPIDVPDFSRRFLDKSSFSRNRLCNWLCNLVRVVLALRTVSLVQHSALHQPGSHDPHITPGLVLVFRLAQPCPDAFWDPLE